MSNPSHSNVSSKYGAPMGRGGSPLGVGLVHLAGVCLDQGGYDPGGAYWGTGQPLFVAWDDEGGEVYLRAANLEAAKSQILADHHDPEALTFQNEIDTDDFLSAYIECALWSSTDNADDSGGEPLDANYEASDIAPETLKEMKKDCEAFLAANAADLSGITAEQAGHDFWLTRNGHGAGFWDRDLGELGDRLSDACKPFGSYDLYVGDDGQIHGS